MSTNVRKAVKDLGIDYPVAVDNNFAIWRAFRNNYWPAHYFIDARGRIRHHHYGEGGYSGSERVIQQLLAEAHPGLRFDGTAKVAATGVQAAPASGGRSTRDLYRLWPHQGLGVATRHRPRQAGDPTKPRPPPGGNGASPGAGRSMRKMRGSIRGADASSTSSRPATCISCSAPTRTASRSASG